ncbi:MAG: hypothetical protein LIP03_01930 [Bacteroidales bacterium]|nr:hypothetical protein [Bacteroidales bacterium]
MNIQDLTPAQIKKDGYLPVKLHKPHPGNIVKLYALKQLRDFLIEQGLLVESQKLS